MKEEFDYQKLVMGSLMARKQRNNKYQAIANRLLPAPFKDLVKTINSKEKFLACINIIVSNSNLYGEDRRNYRQQLINEGEL